MLLRIEGLCKRYGGVHALDDVSLRLEKGAVLGLVGDNGAGKSTLVKCITGAEIPDGGDIVFEDNRLVPGRPRDSRLAGIEMIYQDLDLCLQQDAVSNIFLGRESLARIGGAATPFLDFKLMKRQAAALIESLGADIDVDKRTGALSGGQRQVIAIARALLLQPKLLIMDEPTAALGVREAARVLALIGTLKRQGIAVILISHRLGDVFEVADRIVLMKHGRVCEDKPLRETSLQDITHKILTA